MSEGKNKVRLFFRSVLALMLMLSIPCITLAQDDPPGDGCDPYDGCSVPLDTWVFVLVAIAFIYGVYHLHKKQKSLSA
nr:hypothetical protein [uncultured Mucilaginibacter sp.]